MTSRGNQDTHLQACTLPIMLMQRVPVGLQGSVLWPLVHDICSWVHHAGFLGPAVGSSSSIKEQPQAGWGSGTPGGTHGSLHTGGGSERLQRGPRGTHAGCPTLPTDQLGAGFASGEEE